MQRAVYNGAMTVQELDAYLRSQLRIDDLARTDSSHNGFQVGRRKQEVSRVACAVDACMETFRRAAEWNADVVLTHHGLFWGRVIPVTGGHYERLRFLMEHDIALYALHLPLDMHPEFGNNAVMARELGLEELQEFGLYKGFPIGFRGVLPQPRSLSQITDTLFGGNEEALGILPFGPEEIRSVGLVSGGATFEVHEAISEDLDLYITGDASHTVYHTALEAHINVIFGGHYLTEVWGPRALGERLNRDTGLETVFIDVPTGF